MKNVFKIELTNYEEAKTIMGLLVYVIEDVTFKLKHSKLKTKTTLHVITNKHALNIISIIDGLPITKHRVSFKIDGIWHFSYIGGTY